MLSMAVAKPHVGRFERSGQMPLLGDVDRDADQLDFRAPSGSITCARARTHTH